MKKFLAVLFALLMLFGAVLMTACGSGKKEKTGIYAAADSLLNVYAKFLPEKGEPGVHEKSDKYGNKFVSEYNENGDLITRTQYRQSGEVAVNENFEYNNNGKLVKISVTFDENLPRITTFKYNKDGYIEEISYENQPFYDQYEAGEKSLSRTTFSYDKSGKIISSITYLDTNEIVSKGEYAYDEENHKITITDSRTDGIRTATNYYSDNWILLKSETYGTDGILVYGEEYYENGNPKYIFSSYSYDGYKKFYNENGEITEYFVFDEDGKEHYHATYQYNEAGYLIKKRISQRASYSPDVEYEYAGKADDEHEIKRSVYSLGGKLLSVTEYDADGNIIKTEVFD